MKKHQEEARAELYKNEPGQRPKTSIASNVLLQG